MKKYLFVAGILTLGFNNAGYATFSCTVEECTTKEKDCKEACYAAEGKEAHGLCALGCHFVNTADKDAAKDLKNLCTSWCEKK